MPFSKTAITDFLDRPRQSHKWLKKVDKYKLLDKLVDCYGIPLRFKTVPDQYQVVYFYLCMAYPNFIVSADLGLGKTKILLDVFSIRYKLGHVSKLLWVVPQNVHLLEFEEQAKIHSDFSVTVLDNGSNKNYKTVCESETCPIVVVTYPGLVAMLTTRVRTNGKVKTVLDNEKIAEFIGNFGMVVFDEVHKCKSHSTFTHKIGAEFGKIVPYRYGATGTPFGRHLEDLWAEFFVVDRGETLGASFYLFRDALFTKIPMGRFSKLVISEDNKSKLHRMIQHRSLWYSESEVLNLPSVIWKNVPIGLGQEALGAYKSAKSDLRNAAKSELTRNKISRSIIALRMICSGFVYHRPEEDSSDFNTVYFPNNHKIEYLRYLISDLDEEEKIVVFYFFIESGNIIRQALESDKVSYVWVDSTQKEKQAAMREFKYGKARVLLGNYNSVASGVNLQMARVVVLFEPCLSYIDYRQAIKRCARRGQKRRVLFVALRVIKSIEERQWEYTKEGKNLVDAVVSGKIDPENL